MDEDNFEGHPVLIKAQELADEIKNSEEFKEQDVVALQLILTDCNKLITELIQVDYMTACRPKR
ncbi:MAG: hypothetical protein ACOCQX_03790 [Candidatus Nanoarchaeia archaeon]